MVDSAKRVEQILGDLDKQTAYASEDLSLPDRLVQACSAALQVSGVGLVWMSGAGPGAMLAATDGVACVMEELQFVLGEGPCIESSRLYRPVLTPDLTGSGGARWPEFTAGALAAGACAVFAFPLQVGRIPLGVLELYRTETGPLTDQDLREALAFSDAATSLLLDLHSQMDPAQLHQALMRPVSMRDQVHQATGMIAVQAGVTLVEALVLLRAHSYTVGRSINDLATDVIGRVLRFDPNNEDR